MLRRRSIFNLLRGSLIPALLLFPGLARTQSQQPEIPAKKFSFFKSNLAVPEKVARKINRNFLHSTDTSTFRSTCQYAEGLMTSRGFAEYALDSFRLAKDSLQLTFHTGPLYLLGDVSLRHLAPQEQLRLGFDKRGNRKNPFVLSELERRLAGCLDGYQNKGYPFARFDSLKMELEPVEENVVKADLDYVFDAGPLVKIDTILFEGKFRENERFIQTLAGVRPGDIFDQSVIDNIPRALNNSIYFRNVKGAKVQFQEEMGIVSATVKVAVEPKRTGKFDLLLGLLPPRQNDTRLQFTGLIDLQLVSPFMRAGEVVQFRFDKLPGSSQKLHLQYQQPYIFGSPLKAEFEFNMLKQDTVFLNRWFRFTGGYALSSQLSLKIWYRNKSSSLISTTAYEDDSTRVPPVLDGKDQLWGAGFTFDNLDYRFNPTKGWLIRADFGIGSKRITENPKLPDNIYRNLDLKQPKREAEFEIQYYHSFRKRWVVLLANKTFWLSQDQYFQNDLLQVGGSRSIRGFNENEFFTDFYSFFTVENRFILERNSWLFVFADYAYLQNQIDIPVIQRPLGIGVGMVYETKAGMVSLTYAVGRTDNIPFQPSRGRIHIGLINQF